MTKLSVSLLGWNWIRAKTGSYLSEGDYFVTTTFWIYIIPLIMLLSATKVNNWTKILI